MNRLFTMNHEWLTVDKDVATVGITDYWQSQFGKVDIVKLPQVGQWVEKGKAVGVVKSVEDAELLSPLTGEVVDVNSEIVADPVLFINKEWFFKIRSVERAELADLLDEAGNREWLTVDKDVATVGITDYWQSQFGKVDIVNKVDIVKLPQVGQWVEKGKAVGVVKSVKDAELLSPLTGEVVDVNSEIVADPALVNKDPMRVGWFFKIQFANRDELFDLLDETGYHQALVPKKIILLSDGTGNAAGKVWRTNVWRVFQSLELKGSNQIAIYDDGVGTSSFKPLAILGGVFGYGLKRNVLTLYKFLCRNYKPHDKIYAFGFSRGAFTIRIVVGFVLNQGLVQFANEAELDKKARAAYRAYRHKKYPARNLQYPFRLARFWLDKLLFNTSCERPVEDIEFVGVWDTVAAYGLPIDEMTRGVDKWIWPLELPNKEFNPKILKARHALALDDERATFHPVLWDEDANNTNPPSGVSRATGGEKLLQVWFAGVHSNVGGGYPDDSLANISLAWMMAEAKEAGLLFKNMPDDEPDALLSTDSAKDKDGRLYDSRSGLGGYYRYSPRKLSDFYDAMPAAKSHPRLPKIHDAVFGRIKIGAHFYAPIVFPAEYEVVKSTDATVTYSPTGPTISNVASTIEPNSTAIAEGEKASERHADQEDIWDIVWRKRAIYFLTVFVTGYLLLYPLFRDSYAFQELRTPLRIVSDTIRLIGSVLPGLASRWLNAYARDPGWFLVWAFLVAFLTWISASLAGSINDGMRLLWTKSLPRSNKPAKPNAPPFVRAIARVADDRMPKVVGAIARRAGSISSLLQCILFVGAIAYVLIYPCFSKIRGLGWLVLGGAWNDILLAYSAQPVRPVLFAFLIVYLLPGVLVKKLRQWTFYQSTFHYFKYEIVPRASAIVLLYLAIAFGSHYLFSIRDSFGNFCTETPGLDANHNGFKEVAGNQRAEFIFDTSPEAANKPNNLCVSTGVFLETGTRYHVVVERLPSPPTGKWTFFGEDSYMGGSRLSKIKSIIMTLLFPFRRSFDRPWGNIILRIGSKGNEEDFLDRAPPKQSDSFLVDEKDFAVPDKSETLTEVLTPKRDGELFVYLNKPVLGIYPSWLGDLIGNTGRANILIEK